ncbi:hypothetical protein OVY01_08275 [Robbsia sp. Bb-Pol-6]|uniref:Uncharacterized protein n=1 Tax=Robbsia betulipollinis TaxID=2981849 RepID=A0ABT3ZMP5_9BURK|nr:hypothetical protein [Robbsia betulipollinis]MCY0387228.1 hypothetical protein [Robbsia betulipollinis]
MGANQRLTTLLDETEASSATQKYLRKFLYALHLLKVTGLYSPCDANQAEKRTALGHAFIDAINAGAARHARSPGKADEVFSASLDLNSSTGRSGCKVWSKAWAALNEALAQRSGGASDMDHLNAYYEEHVVPRTMLRAQFVYGETTNNAEARLCSGSKQAVWDASRQLLCAPGANPEERGLNLACASELLHMMPEFLRRPENKADAPKEPGTGKAAAAGAPPNGSPSNGNDADMAAAPAAANARAAGSRGADDQDGRDTGVGGSDQNERSAHRSLIGRDFVNKNSNGDQVMIGPTIHMTQLGGTDSNAGLRAGRHGGAHQQASARAEESRLETAATEGAETGDLASDTVNASHTGGHRGRLSSLDENGPGPSDENESRPNVETSTVPRAQAQPQPQASDAPEKSGLLDQLADTMNEAKALHDAGALRRKSDGGDGQGILDRAPRRAPVRSSSEESVFSPNSPAPTSRSAHPSRAEVGGMPPDVRGASSRAASPSETAPRQTPVRSSSEESGFSMNSPTRTYSFTDPSRAEVGGMPFDVSRASSRNASARAPRTSPSPRAWAHQVSVQRPVILTAGLGQQTPSETVRAWQGDRAASLSPERTE